MPQDVLRCIDDKPVLQQAIFGGPNLILIRERKVHNGRIRSFESILLESFHQVAGIKEAITISIALRPRGWLLCLILALKKNTWTRSRPITRQSAGRRAECWLERRSRRVGDSSANLNSRTSKWVAPVAVDWNLSWGLASRNAIAQTKPPAIRMHWLDSAGLVVSINPNQHAFLFTSD